jgi:penicillin-binding protein 2
MSGPRLSSFKVKKFGKEIDPSEILLDSLAHSKEREMGVSEKKLETPISRHILQGFLVVFLLTLVFIFAKTFQLQIIDGKEYSRLARENQYAVRMIEAERGVIYDRDMNQLAFNRPSFDLAVLTNNLPGEESARNAVLRKAAEVMELDFNDIKERVSGSNLAELIIARNISHQSIIILEAEKENLSGLEIINSAEREYLSGSLFSHLLGYKRKTGQKAGLESYYDEVLTSKPGELYVERDVYGQPISKEVVSMPQSGNSLVLWLDSGLQEKIASSLASSMKRVGGTGAAAVALDPKTGGVLALVSLPDYDGNLFSQGISQEDWGALQSNPSNPLFNRAISGFGYPTGSTIKPLIATAALEEGIIKADTKIYSPLQICIENPWFPEAEPQCYADWKYHGTSDVKRAIAESVNTFFYQVGGGYEDFKGLGPTKIKKWLQEFNWGSETGIDLPKEGVGILPNLEDEWTTGKTYHLSIGQGPFSITPIQVASAYAAIANGGKIFQPKVVKEIIDSNKEVVEEMGSNILKVLPVSQENLETVRQGMRQAVTSPEGSSYSLNWLPVEAAAKTGTSQTGKEDVYHNWITVFAPYDDPEIVLTIVVENVQGAPQGIPAAVLPVASEALGWYFSTRETP